MQLSDVLTLASRQIRHSSGQHQELSSAALSEGTSGDSPVKMAAGTENTATVPTVEQTLPVGLNNFGIYTRGL